MGKGKRKRRTWGTVDSKSRSVHVLRWHENTEKGRVRRCKTVRGTRKEAELELDRLHVLHGEDRPVPTIGKVYEMWYLPWATDSLRPRSVGLYSRMWEKHIAPKWAKVPVDSVKPVDVQEWLSTLTKSTAEVSMAVLKKAVDFAVLYELVPANKFRLKYAMPKENDRKKDARTYGLEECDRVWGLVRDSPVEAPYLLAAFGGCRYGESLAAKGEDVRREAYHGVSCAVVRIDKQLHAQGRAPVGYTKNAQSTRECIVPGRYGERLLEIAAAREWLSDCGDGLPMNQGMCDLLWRNLVPDAIPFANLRPSWRTNAEMDWRVKGDTLEQLMGHVLPGVTGRHYMRPTIAQLGESLCESCADFVQDRQN
ncbi:hypothetical protein GMI70_07095 [Eggerthellaceae bacterium zg-893]|nr:hypothetical protein [Eggerthellaceae bacterium zg-893]